MWRNLKGNRMKQYTTAMKRKLVAAYATGDFPRREFLAKHQIPNSTFHQWIHAYAEELLPALDVGMTVSGFRRLKNDCDRQVMQEQKLVSVRGIYRHEYLKELRSRDNLINKEFNPAAPNVIWVSDVTEIWHKDKKFYICVAIDLFARKVVSWRIGQFNNTRLTLGTFLDAFAARGNPKALTFHTDRGANYTSFCFSRRIQQLQVRRSFSKAHNPYDNSICEAFFKSMKAEELYRRRYRSVRDFKNSVATYIAEYNIKRPHAANNYLTPDEKESRWREGKTDEAVRSCPEN